MRISDNLFWRRLHSFTGFAALGGYLLFHLYTNSWSLGGAASYDAHIKPLRQMPYLIGIEIFFIFLPLAYHSLYGLYVWYTGKSNALRYGYARNWLYTMQRVTGLVVLVFVVYHIYDQRLQAEPSFMTVQSSISNPTVLILYVLGVAAAAWHMFNGLWNALIKWGVTIGARAQRISLALFSVMGAGLIYMGLRALAGFMR